MSEKIEYLLHYYFHDKKTLNKKLYKYFQNSRLNFLNKTSESNNSKKQNYFLKRSGKTD